MAERIDRLKTALSDRYAIERELGTGGMATVYLARDLKHDRWVAVKVLDPYLAASLGADRFLREIKVTARLTHPHILPLLDSGEAHEQLFYVMPFVDGQSLRDRLNREQELPLDDAIAITTEVADALSYAHRLGVVHRDIKPENIMIESGHAVVLDFGIARAIDAAGDKKLTETGLAVGTTAYLSPEQASAKQEVDGRSDIYSLGCVLFEMLAGRPPFVGPTSSSIVRQHLGAEIPSVTTMRPTVPAHVGKALQRALAKTPADRFKDASEFADALKQPLSTPLMPDDRSRATMTHRGKRGLAVIAAAAIVVLTGAAILLRDRAASDPSAAHPYPRTSIAVLPFENLSSTGPNAYFADGLQNELLTQLSKIGALTVKSRTSVMGYRGARVPPIRQIASELGVGSLVEASVQVVGNRLRVNVELIDAATNAHIWADQYDRTLDDAFAIQSDVANQVAAALGAALTRDERRDLATNATTNPEAYRLYMRGREYGSRPGYVPRNLDSAQVLYESALRVDPNFAIVHATLSELEGLRYWIAGRSAERAHHARDEADAALRLIPTLPEGHSALGTWYYYVQRDYPRAVAEYGIALRGLPNDGELWQRFGAVNRRMGTRLNDVFAAYEKAAQLAPRNADIFKELGVTYSWAHRYGDAVKAYDRAVSLAPEVSGGPKVFKGVSLLLWRGQSDTLRAHLPHDVWKVGGLFAIEGLRMLRWNRQGDSMLAASKLAPDGNWEDATHVLPAALCAGWANVLRGDQRAARVAFDSALSFIDKRLQSSPGDERLHAARGFALAGLHRFDDARAEARWLRQSPAYRLDHFQGVQAVEDRAEILAATGDADQALDEIESLLARPSYVSVARLRLDPAWDPVRTHPRFGPLLAKFSTH